MATATKKKKKAYPWKAGTSSRHTTNLKQSILRLSISMGAPYKGPLFVYGSITLAKFVSAKP